MINLYAGVAGYTGGEVVWTGAWVASVAGTAPVVSNRAGGKVQVAFANPGAGGAQGTLTLTATLDGRPCAGSLTAVATANHVAWGPPIATPPAPLTVVFLDTFTGSAGALEGHVPDVSPSPSVWSAVSGVSSALNGAGQINPTTNNSGTPQQTVSRFIPDVLPFNSSAGWALRVVFSNNDTVQSTISRGSSVSVFTSAQVLMLGKTAADAYAVRVRNVDATVDFDDVAVSAGEHEAQVIVTATDAKLYIDGLMVQTRSRSAALPASLGVIEVQQWASGTDAEHAISLIELRASPPVALP